MTESFEQTAKALEDKGLLLIEDIKIKLREAMDALAIANKELEECPKEDARENAQLQTAREKQARANHECFMQQKRLDAFESSLTNYEPIGVITMGTTVQITLVSIDGNSPDASVIASMQPPDVVSDETTKAERTLRMVHHDASDIASGFMSIDSRLGAAIIGHVEGDEITINAPRGTLCYKIERIY